MSYTSEQIQDLLQTHFGLQASKIKQLVGYIDWNFRIQTTDGQSYILKLTHPETTLDLLDLQNQMMLHLKKTASTLHLPQPIPTLQNQLLTTIQTPTGETRYMRLLTWLEGRMWVNVKPHSTDLVQQLGNACGQLSHGLKDFDHPAAKYFFKWNPSEAIWLKEAIHHITAPENRAVAHYFLQLFEETALPKLPHLPQSICHLDVNDHNTLVSETVANPTIVGFIDFGDAIYTHTINEVAIACSYALQYKKDPLSTAITLLSSYHKIHPLQPEEIEVLFSLIASRVLISVTCSAIERSQNTDNAYIFVSEKSGWHLLHQLRAIDPNFAHYTFRQACGWEAHPHNSLFLAWVEAHKNQFASVVDVDWANTPKQILDLSVGSLDLGNNADFETAFIVKDNNIQQQANITIGKYLETRPIYTTDSYLVIGNEGPVWRTVHIGLDIGMPAETPIFAPLSGKVHSFQNNAFDKDYGPTIILEHQVTPDLTFYTLYGHLSLDSLEDLAIGMPIEKGQQIAKMGAKHENGNWQPHLHFQVMLDMLGKTGDFPGVAFPHEIEVWVSLCPNPNLLAQVTGDVVGALGHQLNKDSDNKKDLLKRRQKVLGRNLSLSYQQPLKIVRGYGQYLYDHTGRRYLDTANNVAHVGHEHPKVVRAAQRQAAVLNTNSRYLHDNLVEFAEQLLAKIPAPLEVCYFVNSGSEANELALRMAQTVTKQRNMLVLEVGYHGNTNACIDLSSYKFDGKGGQGQKSWVHTLPIPDPYRGKYRGNTAETGKKYAKEVLQHIERLQAKGQGIAGFLAEPILSCGGQIVPPPDFFKEAYQHIRQAGGLCIADEVQIGFGRVGSHFWGFELHYVVPDIVTMGKPIGNGHPLGAVVCTRAVAEAFDNGMEFFSTFGGNPVSCAVGKAVLEVIKTESLQQNALEVGSYLLKGLRGLQKCYPIIGDVRGHGLFLGFELVKNQDTLEPAEAQTSYLSNRMRDKGILLSTDGPYHNVIKIKPPICFNKQDADFLLMMLDEVLQEDVMTNF